MHVENDYDFSQTFVPIMRICNPCTYLALEYERKNSEQKEAIVMRVFTIQLMKLWCHGQLSTSDDLQLFVVFFHIHLSHTYLTFLLDHEKIAGLFCTCWYGFCCCCRLF